MCQTNQRQRAEDDDKQPNQDESKLLHDEGFRFDPAISSWTMPAIAKNRLLAEHAFNGVLESRVSSHRSRCRPGNPAPVFFPSLSESLHPADPP
jgi:hypothetical protein